MRQELNEPAPLEHVRHLRQGRASNERQSCLADVRAHTLSWICASHPFSCVLLFSSFSFYTHEACTVFSVSSLERAVSNFSQGLIKRGYDVQCPLVLVNVRAHALASREQINFNFQ